MTSRFSSIFSIQTMPPRSWRTRSTLAETSRPSSGVSGAPAQRTSWAAGSRARAASSRWGTPFWRVMRPTKITEGRSGSTP